MNAPEKIYLIRNISTPTSLNTTNDCHEKYLQEWYRGREKDTDIEYIRKDAFIEKALGRLKHYLDNSVWVANDVGVREKEVIIEDFEEYLKK